MIGLSGHAPVLVVAAVAPGASKPAGYGSISEQVVEPQALVVYVEVPRPPPTEDPPVGIRVPDEVEPPRLLEQPQPRALILPEAGFSSIHTLLVPVLPGVQGFGSDVEVSAKDGGRAVSLLLEVTKQTVQPAELPPDRIGL